MGTAFRCRCFCVALSLTFTLALLLPAGIANAGERAERYVCPLRQAVAPQVDDPEVFSATGPVAEDFRLFDVHGGGLTCFLETARSDYTFIYFLGTASQDSLLSLNFLERLRDRFRGRVGLTAVFLDPTAKEEIRTYLDIHSLAPDFVLHDPRGTQAKCYGFDSPSVLHVVGPQGRIIFTASEDDPVDLAAFTEALDRLLTRTCDYSSFAEARGIYDDAVGWIREGSPEMAALYLHRVLELQPQLHTIHRLLADIYFDLGKPRLAARHYGRYLAAGEAYDVDEIRRNLKRLASLSGAEER